MKKYTITNTFHNTEASFLAKDNHDGALAAFYDLLERENAHLSDYKTVHRKVLRIQKALCPHSASSCKCMGMVRAA